MLKLFHLHSSCAREEENFSSNVRQRGNGAKRISRHLRRVNVMGIQNTPFTQWKRRGPYFLLSPLFPLSLFTPPWPCFPSTCPAEWERTCSTDRGVGVEERQKESQIKVLKIRGKGKAEGGGVAKKQKQSDWPNNPRRNRRGGTGTGSKKERGREDENICAVASVVRQGRLLSL